MVLWSFQRASITHDMQNLIEKKPPGGYLSNATLDKNTLTKASGTARMTLNQVHFCWNVPSRESCVSPKIPFKHLVLERKYKLTHFEMENILIYKKKLKNHHIIDIFEMLRIFYI